MIRVSHNMSLLALFPEPERSLSENSWGPVPEPTTKPSLSFNDFRAQLNAIMGGLEISDDDFSYYYSRYVQASLTIEQVLDEMARDRLFSPLSQTMSFPQVRVADLGSSVYGQEYQLAFKQKAKSSFKVYDYQKKNIMARRALARRTNQKQTLTKEQEKERKIQMDKMSKMKGQKYRERKRWNDKINYFSKPLTSSVEIRSTWDPKATLLFTKLQKEEYKSAIQSIILKDAGYVHFYNPQHDKLTTRSAKKLVVPKAPKFVYYSTKTVDDPHLLQFAQESTAPLKVVITDRILSLIMASTRSVLSWDLVVIKKDGQLIFDKRDNKQRVDIISVDETSRTPPDNSENTDDIDSEKNLAMEATRVNLQFHRFSLNQPENPTDGPGVYNLNDEEPHPFKKADHIPAPVGYRYKKFLLNGFDVVCRCEIDGAAGSEDDPRLLTIRALNEWKPKSREDWRSLLDNSMGRVITTEIKNNACKFARWVSQAILAGTDEMKIGFVSRVDSRKKSPHVVLGVGTYLIPQLSQQIGLSKRNMWGILKSIVSEMEKLEDGKYSLVKQANKQSIQIYRISSTVGGCLVFRKTGSDRYQFLLLKLGDNTIIPSAKTEQSEDEAQAARRALKNDLGLEEKDVAIVSDFVHESQYQDDETCEERTEKIFACNLLDISQEIVLSENYGDYEWFDVGSAATLDTNISKALNSFTQYAKTKGGISHVF